MSGTLCKLATQLGYKAALLLLEANLEEERATDEELAILARSGKAAKQAA